MSLNQDLDSILTVVKRTDPSFATVDPQEIDAHIEELQRHASETASERFLLCAMGLLALGGNGHTRMIPNDAISVLPLRFVTIGESVFLTKASPAFEEFAPSRLIAVNGIPVEWIERAASPLLAGTGQRQRVIGPLLFAWPAALAHMGFAPIGPETRYQLEGADGWSTVIEVPNDTRVPASELYPRNEHGQVDPVWNYKGFVEIYDGSEHGLAIKLPSFFDPTERAFPQAIEQGAAWVQSRCARFFVIDVRGNTGGDFLMTMLLIDAIAERAQQCGCAIVVDKFTFSAAIVFVAILKHRLGRKLKIVGEEMGDGLRFFAEGGLIEMPSSGAIIRYATARHDWETGSVDQTTPPEIARHMVPVHRLNIDRRWCSTPFDATPDEILYDDLVRALP